jgi:hypothetical protein
MGMKLDFSDFERDFKRIIKKVPNKAAKGLFEAGNELLRDAIKKKPYAPFDQGHLRGSAETNKAQITKYGIELEVGFNIEYAARWHELTPMQDKRINWTLPGSGAKYLEKKMMMYKNRYMKMVADAIGVILK